MADFVIKDSGERQTFEGGMVRDTDAGKTNYLLVRDGPMFLRWAQHLTKGAKKYAARNWMLAKDAIALERARSSASRHFEQWLRGDQDEDHAAAVFFNINEVEYILGQQQQVDTVGEHRALLNHRTPHETLTTPRGLYFPDVPPTDDARRGGPEASPEGGSCCRGQ